MELQRASGLRQLNDSSRGQAEALAYGADWTRETAEALLLGGYWFGTLPQAMKRAIVDSSEIRRFKRGSFLYRIGDRVDGLHAALEGDLRAHVYGDEGERILLRFLGPKSWFGEFHLIDNYPTRTFELSAASDCTTLFLPKVAYQRIISDPEYYRSFVALTCIHQRFIVRMAVEARSDAPRRAARALIRIAKMHGKTVEKGTLLAINISQSDLASLIGVSRQYMNELISSWNEQGRVIWKGNAFPVVFVDQLKSLLTPLDEWMLESESWA